MRRQRFGLTTRMQGTFQIAVASLVIALAAVVEVTIDPDGWLWTVAMAGAAGSFVAAVAEPLVARARRRSGSAKR